MTQLKLGSAWLGGVLLLAGAVGILESGAADVFLEATRPDFQKIPVGVVGIHNAGGPDWLSGRIEEVLKKDVKRSLVFDLVDFHADHLQDDVGDQGDEHTDHAHEPGDDDGVKPHIVVVPGSKEAVDAAQLIHIRDFLLQGLGLLRRGPRQGGQTQ